MTERQIELVAGILGKLTTLVLFDSLLALIALGVALFALVRAGEDR